jgi:hypothetical protein
MEICLIISGIILCFCFSWLLKKANGHKCDSNKYWWGLQEVAEDVFDDDFDD